MEYYINTNNSINKTLEKCASGDIIYLDEGIYYEKVIILVDNIKIIGKDSNKTIISNNDFYHKIMKDYNECNTFRTYTCYVGSDNVTITNLTIRNTATPSSKYGQAVALHVDGNEFNCNGCNIESAQDTLFTGPMPSDLIKRHENFLPSYQRTGKESIQKYNKCKIIGDVDFIFGCATALFYMCDIISIANERVGYISAPSHPLETQYGYLFYKCNLIGESFNNVYLGRPWRDYGSAAFIKCNMGKHICELGFNKWNDTNRDKTARFYEYTENLDLSKREPWSNQLNLEQANRFIKKYFEYIGFKEN